MLCLSGFELYPRWVTLTLCRHNFEHDINKPKQLRIILE